MLTRKYLKSLKIEEGQLSDEQIDDVIARHTETTDALKDERDTFKADAEALPKVTKERDKLQKDLEDLKAKAPDAAKVRAEFDEYKLQVETEKANEKKLASVCAALKAAGANETAIELLAQKVDLATVELDENGEVKNADAVVDPIKAKYAGLFGKLTEDGVPPVNPPKGKTKMTKEDYQKLPVSDQMKYANEHPAEVDALLHPPKK
jgi:hypothetical protein